jgi:hypothetical protein
MDEGSPLSTTRLPPGAGGAVDVSAMAKPMPARKEVPNARALSYRRGRARRADCIVREDRVRAAVPTMELAACRCRTLLQTTSPVRIPLNLAPPTIESQTPPKAAT